MMGKAANVFLDLDGDERRRGAEKAEHKRQAVPDEARPVIPGELSHDDRPDRSRQQAEQGQARGGKVEIVRDGGEDEPFPVAQLGGDFHAGARVERRAVRGVGERGAEVVRPFLLPQQTQPLGARASRLREGRGLAREGVDGAGVVVPAVERVAEKLGGEAPRRLHGGGRAKALDGLVGGGLLAIVSVEQVGQQLALGGVDLLRFGDRFLDQADDGFFLAVGFVGVGGVAAAVGTKLLADIDFVGRDEGAGLPNPFGELLDARFGLAHGDLGHLEGVTAAISEHERQQARAEGDGRHDPPDRDRRGHDEGGGFQEKIAVPGAVEELGAVEFRGHRGRLCGGASGGFKPGHSGDRIFRKLRISRNPR